MFQCLTLNHHAAPAWLRERFALSGETLRAALHDARRTKGIERLVILATCQRIELYSAHPPEQDTRQLLTEWLAAQGDVSADTVAAHSEYLEGMAVAQHLCRVATGLDATLLGEAQILTQVAGAIRVAVAEHAASPAIKTLFRTAVQAGERARGAVWSRYARTDVGSVALEIAARALEGIAGKHAVVVGAGEVAELAVRAFRSHGVASIAIVNRTRDRAATLGAQFGAKPYALNELQPLIGNADVLFVATSAPAAIVDAEMVRTVMHDRPGRPLVVVDAAMPRNVDPHVRDVPSAMLFDLDDLAPTLAHAQSERASAIPLVETIIARELGVLESRYAPRQTQTRWQQPQSHASIVCRS